MIYIIGISMIVLAIIERILYHKKIKGIIIFNIMDVRFLLKLLIYIAIFTMAFLVTDTNIGLLYVSMTIGLYYMILMATYRWRDTIPINLLIIFGIPLLAILFFIASKHILIDLYFIILPIILTGVFLSHPNQEKRNAKGYALTIIGILLGIIVFFLYRDLFTISNTYKQESVAREFLEQKLNITESSISTERKLRGQDTRVTAYSQLEDCRINMIYRNNSIISYEIEE